MTRVNKYWDDRDPGEIGMNGVGRGSITEEESAVLQVVFKGLDRVLEIGTGLGDSTRAIASVVRELVTLDIDPWVVEVISQELPDNVVFSTTTDGHGRFNGAFIDGNHSEESVASDIRRVLPLLEPGAPIVFHDYHFGGVSRAVAASGLVVLEVYQTKLPMCRCEAP